MNAVYEYGQRREEEGRKEGIKEVKKQVVEKMIKDGQDNQTINKYTDLNNDEINKIRQEITD